MRAVIFACSVVVTAALFGCQGQDLTSPGARGLDFTGKKGGIGGGGGGSSSVMLGGGYSTTSPQPGGLKVSGRRATFETPFEAPIPISLNVDQDGGGLGSDQLPKRDQLNWGDCIWNADIASPYDAANVPQAARDLWDTFMTSYGSERPRLLFLHVDLAANGTSSWDHQSLTRWFTTEGSEKTMWEFEVGAEPTLSLIQPVASWDGTSFRFSGGILRVTRTRCGSKSGPDGCVPARGSGNRPTVVCRNDDTAFSPGATFTATTQ